MNNYKNFINYFKRSDSIASTGMGILAAGGLMFLLGWWFFWILFYIGVPMIPIGLAIYLYGTSGTADENDLKKIIKENADSITLCHQNRKANTVTVSQESRLKKPLTDIPLTITS